MMCVRHLASFLPSGLPAHRFRTPLSHVLCQFALQYEGGEPCSICGHVLVLQSSANKPTESVMPTSIVPGFLYLGSYDTASRSEVLKAMAITHMLNVRRLQHIQRACFLLLTDTLALRTWHALRLLDVCWLHLISWHAALRRLKHVQCPQLWISTARAMVATLHIFAFLGHSPTALGALSNWVRCVRFSSAVFIC